MLLGFEPRINQPLLESQEIIGKITQVSTSRINTVESDYSLSAAKSKLQDQTQKLQSRGYKGMEAMEANGAVQSVDAMDVMGAKEKVKVV